MKKGESYYQSTGSPPLLESTIPEHFSYIVARFPDREAVVSRLQDIRLSYRQFAARVDELAMGLLGCGFSRGERIGIWSTNNLQWLLLQMATARIGAVLVTINPAYRSRELAFALQRSQVQGLFLIPSFRASDYVQMLLELLPELETDRHDELCLTGFPFLRTVVLLDPKAPMATSRPASGFTLWQEMLAMAAASSPGQLDAATRRLKNSDPINIQYTSGTTGFPKPVLLTHRNILNNACFSALLMQFTEQDRLCVAVPFYHCFGLVLANLLCLSVGACIVIACEHFDPLQVLKGVEEERCTGLHGVPTMFIAELEHPDFASFDLTSLRTGIMAGAPCPPVLLERVMHEMHCRNILIGYGETEASPLTHLTRPDDSMARRINSVGRNLPHQEVSVRDPVTGKIVPLGETGELCFRGYHVMLGYYRDPEATAGAIDPEGWLHSGDLGRMDRDGYVQITGRLKEMIIRGGENIYPREIEDFIFTHPKVAEVAVFGVPDDYYGEEIMAWIITRKGEELGEAELREFCKGKIAHYKIPRYIRFVDSFPLTVTGKVQKFRMREMAVTDMGGVCGDCKIGDRSPFSGE